jgi:light-regulated signal transduction histidine kinase (bacteriophytochrome)
MTKQLTQLDEISELTEALKRSNSELEQFAYIASHDLQEPMRMIGQNAKRLEKHLGNQLNEKAKKYLDFVIEGTSRMQKLVEDWLDYSKVNSKPLEFRAVDLNKVFSIVKQDLEIKIKENNASIKVDHLPTVQGDSMLLVRVFENLLSNAIKYRRKDADPVIEVKYEQDNGSHLFSIVDNGIGFDQKYSERVFQLFQRLHSSVDYTGTGLGLTICKKITEQHGGKIWVESRSGVGSTFYIRLPV